MASRREYKHLIITNLRVKQVIQQIVLSSFDYLLGDLFSERCISNLTLISAKHMELRRSAFTAAEEQHTAVINRLMEEPWPLKVGRLFPVWLATQAHAHTAHLLITIYTPGQSNAPLPQHLFHRDNILCIYRPLKSFEYLSVSALRVR